MIRRSIKKAQITLTATFLSLVISGIALLFIPYVVKSGESTNEIGAYVIAGVFWLGILSALAASYFTRSALDLIYEKLVQMKRIQRQTLPGILSFELSVKKMILYGISFIGILLIVSDIAWHFVDEQIMFPIILVSFLSFSIHCVTDGRYYKVYKVIKENMNNETKH